jgi:hypothetical protein
MEQTIQAIFTVGMPTLAVMVGILVNGSRLTDLRVHIDVRINDLRADMAARFADVGRRLDAIELRLDRIEAKLDQYELRITVLEERTNPLRGGVK